MVDENDIKKYIKELAGNKNAKRDKEYLDFMVDKFYLLENRGSDVDEYTSVEKEAFMHGFYVAAGGVPAALERFLKKEGESVATANRAQESFDNMIENYATLAAVDALREYYDEIKDQDDERTLNSLNEKIEKLEEEYAVRNVLTDQFNKGKKYGGIFSANTPFLGMGYTGMEIGKYIKDGGWKDIADRGKDAGEFLGDKFGKGFGWIKDKISKKDSEEE